MERLLVLVAKIASVQYFTLLPVAAPVSEVPQILILILQNFEFCHLQWRSHPLLKMQNHLMRFTERGVAEKSLFSI